MENKFVESRFIIYFASAFIASYIVQEILLNRLISVWHGYITGGTFIYFASPLIIDVVAEVYGFRIAKKLVWSGLFSFLFLAISIFVCFMMPYPKFWKSTIDAYQLALGSVVRTALVSSVTVFLGQLVNTYLITKWKVLLRGRFFWLRSSGSSIIGDAVTVTLTTVGVFSGRVPVGLFTHNILQELVIMVSFSILGAVPATLIVKLVKRYENFDQENSHISYNPFAFAHER